MRAPPFFEDEQVLPVLTSLCDSNRVDEKLLKELCGLVLETSGVGRAEGIDADIADVLDRCLMRRGEK